MGGDGCSGGGKEKINKFVSDGFRRCFGPLPQTCVCMCSYERRVHNVSGAHLRKKMKEKGKKKDI